MERTLRTRRRVVAALHDDAKIHNGHPGREIPHGRQIVGNEQIGEAEAVAQFLQQQDCARSQRHVEGRGRLVKHDEARIGGDRPGNVDALALSAREFMGISIAEAAAEVDFLEQLVDPVAPLRPVSLVCSISAPSIRLADKRGLREAVGS